MSIAKCLDVTGIKGGQGYLTPSCYEIVGRVEMSVTVDYLSRLLKIFGESEDFTL